MTPAEREECDTNPLWSEAGQILWLLDQQGDDSELLTVAEIAARLKLQQPTVSHILRRLGEEGKAREWKVDRRELWGVDWASLTSSMTDPEWALPDGRKVAELFGEGWPQVRDTVSERLEQWRRVDEDVLGPKATLRLLTVGGSTSYTRHWWGQGRWSAICRAIVDDAVEGAIALPSPYDELGVERFVDDLAEPDQLDDEVLEWLIDMPGGGVEGPRGLRFHEMSRPISRVVEPVDWDLD